LESGKNRVNNARPRRAGIFKHIMWVADKAGAKKGPSWGDGVDSKQVKDPSVSRKY